MNEYLFVESKLPIWTLKGFQVPEDAVFMKKISTCEQTVASQAVLRYNTSAYHSSWRTKSSEGLYPKTA
jgi:hypothetical protein